MRDLVAGVVAVALLFTALSLAGTLQAYRRRRRRAREHERTLGRTIVAELPTGDDLVLFSEDAGHFYYGDQAVAKSDIVAARVLINGSPIASIVSPRYHGEMAPPTSFEDRPEGIARDRWDVAIETVGRTTLVVCGAIRERVSQELARAVFDAVKASVEKQS